MAFGSLMEVLNCLIISTDLEMILEKELVFCRQDIDKIGNKLIGIGT